VAEERRRFAREVTALGEEAEGRRRFAREVTALGGEVEGEVERARRPGRDGQMTTLR